MPMNKIYFVIVTYNAVDYIQRTLDSIVKFESDAGIIIVDNGSKDETLKLLSKYPHVHIVPQGNNLGFGKGNNIGISLALSKGADYVYLLNQDAFLLESVTEKLIEILKKHPEIGVISPFQYSPDGVHLETNFEKFMYQQSVLRMYIPELAKRTLSEYYPVDFVQAASWFIPASVLRKVGGFDPIFFHYGEDNHLLSRLKFHGYKVAVVPGLMVAHETNPLKLVQSKYDSYNINRLRALKLNKYTDINKETSLHIYLKDQFNELYRLIISILILQWSSVPGRLKHIAQMSFIWSDIQVSRSTVRNVSGCYLAYSSAVVEVN
jgi:GT2 family glycosyltransferase